MTPAELYQELRLCGEKPPGMGLREALLPLLKGESRVAVRYEWIKDYKGLADRVFHGSNVEIGDGQEWLTIWLTM